MLSPLGLTLVFTIRSDDQTEKFPSNILLADSQNNDIKLKILFAFCSLKCRTLVQISANADRGSLKIHGGSSDVIWNDSLIRYPSRNPNF